MVWILFQTAPVNLFDFSFKQHQGLFEREVKPVNRSHQFNRLRQLRNKLPSEYFCLCLWSHSSWVSGYKFFETVVGLCTAQCKMLLFCIFACCTCHDRFMQFWTEERRGRICHLVILVQYIHDALFCNSRVLLIVKTLEDE